MRKKYEQYGLSCFVEVVPWEQLEMYLTKKELNSFKNTW